MIATAIATTPPEDIKMRIRSYRFHEVRTNIANDGECLCRGNEEMCRQWMQKNQHLVQKSGNLYLVEVQLIYAIKADKEGVRLPLEEVLRSDEQ